MAVTAKKHILITGASGGLGSALALALAADSRRLTLWGRDEQRLRTVEEQCRRKGAETAVMLQDSRAFAGCRAALHALWNDSPVDMAVLNAGVSSGMTPDNGPEPEEDACRTMEVNASGTINMAATLARRMTARPGGHLVFISSIAGLYPLPGSPAYCASKAALACYARALRSSRPYRPVRVSIVYPGYVQSPMSARLMGPQPMRWSAGKAAAHVVAQLDAGKDDIVFPRLLALGVLLLHVLPRPVADFFAHRFAFTVVPDPESPHAARQKPSGNAPHA